ncbi:MAG: 16S rRNA (guanine(966)-N(2))-methyltransferase RsmD [Deltaproteobacteria bacterium]|nr:16S rRNA (guanine(966)-N(2))-methyltransferase RsmD [Deltaproteobacteria bacterium]
MKVIGGDKKGKTIYAPKSRHIRITSDRIKKSLFDILPPMEGMSFLDLYGGTGNVGIEALSRGAKKVVFIERAQLHFQAIKRNLDDCGFQSGYVTIRGDVERGVKLLEKEREKFDVIFVDPPYDRDLIKKSLYLLAVSGLLKKGGIVAVEHSVREEVFGDDLFTLSDQRRYGDTVLSFMKSTE